VQLAQIGVDDAKLGTVRCDVRPGPRFVGGGQRRRRGVGRLSCLGCLGCLCCVGRIYFSGCGISAIDTAARGVRFEWAALTWPDGSVDDLC
jgi:hypothetical protein